MLLFPEDPRLEESDAKRILSPLQDEIQACVLDSAKRLIKMANDDPWVAKALQYNSAAQHMMNSLVVERVKESFANYDGVSLVTEKRFLELSVQGAVDLRFKQVDRNGKTANYPTETSDRYKNQLPLNGDESTLPVARVTIGWIWNDTATDLYDIAVVYAKGDTTLWMYSILKYAESSSGITLLVSPDGIEPSGATFGVKQVQKKVEKDS